MADRGTRKRRHVPDAPAEDERVSLAGPPFEDVLRGLLAVDPKDVDTSEDDDD